MNSMFTCLTENTCLKVAVPETAKTLGKVAKEAKQSIEESKGVIASAVETFNDELNK